jgi:pimeloyl-ACP methyl ester carboxylesterase
MAPQSPEADRWKTWFYYSQGSEAFKGDLHFYSVDHDLRGRLGEIDGDRCPVVMLTGEYDYLTTPEDSARTAGEIKNGAFIAMPEIGHFPMSENHATFRRYLIQGLEALQDVKAKSG